MMILYRSLRFETILKNKRENSDLSSLNFEKERKCSRRPSRLTRAKRVTAKAKPVYEGTI